MIEFFYVLNQSTSYLATVVYYSHILLVFITLIHSFSFLEKENETLRMRLGSVIGWVSGPITMLNKQADKKGPLNLNMILQSLVIFVRSRAREV